MLTASLNNRLKKKSGELISDPALGWLQSKEVRDNFVITRVKNGSEELYKCINERNKNI
jgi:hypothetical protein